MRITLIALVAAAALASCSGVKTKTALTPGGSGALSARTGPVCLMAGGLPDGVQFTEIGRIHATKGTYGERENLMLPMANEARRVGADAIINLQADERFKGPLPWRFTAPTGDGVAVKIIGPDAALDCVGRGGRLL